MTPRRADVGLTSALDELADPVGCACSSFRGLRNP